MDRGAWSRTRPQHSTGPGHRPGHRADTAGQVLTTVPGLAATTAAGLARRFAEGQWVAVETGLGDVHAGALDLLDRVAADRAGVAGGGFAGVEFAIGARRTAPLWRLLDSGPSDGWTHAAKKHPG